MSGQSSGHLTLACLLAAAGCGRAPDPGTSPKPPASAPASATVASAPTAQATAAPTAQASAAPTYEGEPVPAARGSAGPAGAEPAMAAYWQFLDGFGALLKSLFPLRVGDGELVYLRHRILEPEKYPDGSYSHRGKVAVTFELLHHPPKGGSPTKLTVQEVVFCNMKWPTTRATFVRYGEESPMGDMKAFTEDYHAGIRTFVSGHLTRQMTEVKDWRATSPKALIDPEE